MSFPLPPATSNFRPPLNSHFRPPSTTTSTSLYFSHSYYNSTSTNRFQFQCSATSLTSSPQQQLRNETEIENKKYDLLKAIQDTQRGSLTTPNQRSQIEETLVELESYEADNKGIDLGKLDGTWRLQYTSASDVLILLDSSSVLPFFQVGQIFQKFECIGQDDGGYVRNVVRWSIPGLLEENEGATLLVSAKFSIVSRRNIYLQFEEIALQNIKISEELQALIAPALLPRSFLSLQILQAICTYKAQVPVENTSPGRRSVGGLYYLSYLDRNMLVGRAVGGGGVFVFTRSQNIL
ncbi:probable plastid-lipid-associated protein 10, chloroplastic [Rutidosis leptorrhynchoides]|uniref:probable plastid-lipid-associated protein 10, chloroplastic n=1 Tax=Rutidosis leptorrhynchoides TaxID=125765 RepID=UPI003A99ED2F